MLILGALATGAAAADYRPTFDPSRLKGPRAGPPNQVMILGTPHLGGLPKSFAAGQLAPLLDRLAAWRPQAIAIEATSGAQCDALRRYPDRYADTVKSYCWDPAPARAATGLDVPAATAAAQRMLADWPAAPAPAQRRKLAATFLAGGEQASALVQWLRLPEAERHAGDGLDATLVARLETLRTRTNEDFQIAAPLAARLGHERVWAMDDHSADSVAPDEKAAEAAVMKAWNNPVSARRLARNTAVDTATGVPGGVLAMYRWYNAPAAQRMAFDGDFGAALEEPSEGRYGRGYVGYWEVRNLRMAANIRDVLALDPGIRLLVTVGASHKGYLEAYLDQMHDVAVVGTDMVLK